jgi:glycosyltransferase involved in cell wall biosynthesis
MHLGIVSPFPPEISGIGQYGWNVTQGLANTGRFQEITIFTGTANGSIDSPLPTSPVIATRRVWTRDDVASVMGLPRAIQAARPDVVWFNLGFTVFGSSRAANFVGLAAPLLTRRAGMPAVVTLHEIIEFAPPRALGAMNGHITTWGARSATRMILSADAVCVTLRRYVAELRRRYQAGHVLHMPHGAFASPEFLTHPVDAPPREILIFATFAPYKGLPVLLEAFESLRRRDPHVTLVIAGSDHPRFPGYLADVRASLNGAHSNGVRWLGPQPESQLRDVFARARVVALPYTATTGASSVLHRAAAFGRPVIASDLPDIRAVAEEEDLRLEYVPPSDSRALAEALARLLASPARQRELAAHNLSVMQSMTLDHTCARYVGLFERVLSEKQNL